ncbi:hypothetical protein LIER_00994 [Lithospermum erythrorhizon]|uniref:PRA1 family protein n=1 Tax=Lithospermum erythrorhizon TaxID=34254 RepID=A0AAV3NKK7_LITER
MENNNSLHNRSPSSSISTMSHENKPKGSTEEEEDLLCSFKFKWPFNIPPTPEAATSRIIKNIRYFGMYYAQFMWVVLFITLIPKRKVSLVYMVIMKEITLMYIVLLRAIPNSVILHKILDKRIVFLLLTIISVVELILTHAVIHLLASLAGTIPLVLMHGAFWKEERPIMKNEDTHGEELVQLVDHKNEGYHLDSV